MLTDPPGPRAGRVKDALTTDLKHMLGRCSELMQSEFPPLVDRALQRIDDTLYDFADKAESDRTYFAHFDAQRRLRRERANLKRRFLRNMADTIELFQEGARTRGMAEEQSFDSESLTLVGDKDLEESLVLSNMVSKADSRYLTQLTALTRHFAALLGRPGLRDKDTPISPTAITDAFASALRSLEDLDLSTVLVVHKIFDQQVMDGLGAYYDRCLAFAVSQGLDPSVPGHEIIKHADRDAPAAEPDESPADAPAARRPGVQSTSDQRQNTAPGRAPGGGSEPASTGLGAPASACNFETLRRVLAEARQMPVERPDVGTMATADLIALLSNVQPEVALQAAESALTPSALRSVVGDRLNASMDPRAPSQLAPTDEDTLDLMFLLFEQLLVSQDIPDPIKILVSRLQIPYVKIALLDRQFFDDPDYPARRLLNTVALASIGWSEAGPGCDQELYPLIEQIVGRIVMAPDIEPALFVTLERQLSEYARAERDRAAAVEHRTLRDAEARSLRTDALRQARSMIDAQRKTHGGLPAVVDTILERGWTDAMVRAYAESGRKGRDWLDGERILRDLLWSVAPKRDPEERRELLRRIPELLRDLGEQLSAAVVDQQLIARWLKELRSVHIRALRGEAPSTLSASAGSAGARAEVPSDDRGPRLALAGESAHLPPGCWLDIVSDDGSTQRFKLAWRGVDDAGPMLFVDRGGRKAFELPAAELDALLKEGLATVIGTGEEPLVDRAMVAVRQSLSIH